jgi:thioredoxin reductase
MEGGLKLKTEFAVIGGGPAGLCAAIEAAKYGVEVTVIDENLKPGGQLFKQIHRFFGSEEHHAGIRGFEIGNMLLEDAQKYGVNVLLNNVAWGLFEDNNIGLSDSNKVSILSCDKVLVAAGAVENSLSFPGWTLPNVMGAGAAQTMINVNRVLPGKKVVTIGSGNVGLIVSYQLMQAGAEVACVLEGLPEIGGYQVHASKIARMGVPILTRHTVVKAEGEKFVEKVTIAELDENWKIVAGSEREISCDLVCIAVGLRPLTELCWMSGMRFDYVPVLGGFIPIHDENMQTTVSGAYVAGDITGVEEASTAMEEGRLAGLAVAISTGKLEEKKGKIEIALAQERLRALRLGPYGEFRHQAKQKLISGYYKNGTGA